MDRRRIDWGHWSSILTILAAIIAFPIYFGSKMDNNFLFLNQKIDNVANSISQKLDQDMNEIRMELRHLHGRVSACETSVTHIKDDHKEICINYNK